MSRPVLPSQNSRYWGHDLNNYLLSLASDIDEVNRRLNNELEATNTYSIENVGFVTGTYKIRPQDADANANNNGTLWSYTTNGFFKSSSNLYAENKGLLLTGTIGFQVAVNNITQLVFKDLKDGYSIFKQYHIYNYDDQGVIRQAVDNNLDNSFYNVYLHYNPTTATVETLLSQQMLVDPTIVLIGTLDAIEEGNFIFIPRCFSASKTLLTSVRDCLEPKISVDGPATNDGNLPLVKVPYYMMINGINPNRPLTGETMVANYESQDCKRITSDDSGWYWYYFDTITNKEVFQLLANFDALETNVQYDLFLSVSGKVFVRRYGLNNLYPDYNVQSTEDLRYKNSLRTGGLVYMGTYYSHADQQSNIFSCAQTGGIPPILNATHYSWNQIDLENMEIHSLNDEDKQAKILHNVKIKNTNVSPTTYINLRTQVGAVVQFPISGQFMLYPSVAAQSHPIVVHITDNLYNDARCTDKVPASSFAFSGNGKYLKISEGLLNYLKTEPTNTIIGDGLSIEYELEFTPNRYQFSINPTRAVQTIDPAKINLNIPDSDNLMIPVFKNADLEITNNQILLKGTVTSLGNSTNYLTFNTSSELIATARTFTFKIDESYNIHMSTYADRMYVDTKFQSPEFYVAPAASGMGSINITNALADFYQHTSIAENGLFQHTGNFLHISSDNNNIHLLHKNADISPKYSGFSGYGHLCIGATDPTNATTLANTSAAFINTNGDITAKSIQFTSDKRYKTNIKPISASDCLKAVQELDTYTYTYTENNTDSLGMMAQDIERYLPEYAHLLVHEDINGKKYVEEHKLLFILWQAVKELIKQKD